MSFKQSQLKKSFRTTAFPLTASENKLIMFRLCRITLCLCLRFMQTKQEEEVAQQVHYNGKIPLRSHLILRRVRYQRRLFVGYADYYHCDETVT